MSTAQYMVNVYQHRNIFIGICTGSQQICLPTLSRFERLKRSYLEFMQDLIARKSSLKSPLLPQARVCHTNNCPVGVASQREELRARFPGVPGDLVNYFQFIAEEVWPP